MNNEIIKRLKEKNGTFSKKQSRKIVATILALSMSLSNVMSLAEENCTFDQATGEIVFFESEEEQLEAGLNRFNGNNSSSQTVVVNDAKVAGYIDVYNDEEVYRVATEIYNQLMELGDESLSTFTPEEIARYIMIIGGRNPFDDELTFADVHFMVERLYTMMNAEYLPCANYLQGTRPSYDKKTVTLSNFVKDNTIGKLLTNRIEELRHIMINNPNEIGGQAAHEFTELALYSFLLCGSNGYTSYSDAETSGIRLFNVAYLENTADLAAQFGPEYTTVVYTNGMGETCSTTLEEIINQINKDECLTDATDYPYITEATYGTVGEINNVSYKLHN